MPNEQHDRIETDNLSEAEKIIKLRKILGETYGYPEFFSMFHGTGKAAAKNILINGLEARNNVLDETATPIYYADRPYEEQPDEVFEKILHWPHREYRYIVVVMIPSAKKGQQGGSAYTNSVFEELPSEEKTDYGIQGASKKYVIPPRFIKGYIDVNRLEFIKNPAFAPPETIEIKKRIVAIKRAALNATEQPPDIKPTDSTEIW